MNWTPENIGLIVTAIAGLVTAITALIHSRNTRKGITDEMESSLDAETKTSSANDNSSTGRTSNA